MKFEKGQRMLITTDCFFVAPDGKQYRSAWGVCKGVVDAETALGIKTNRGSSNWYVLLGNLLIAGCQIHYAITCDHVNLGTTSAYELNGGQRVNYPADSIIYNAGEE